MAGEKGVKNTLKLVELLAELGNVSEDLVKKGDLFSKGKALLDLTDELFSLSSFDLAEFKLEFKELDAEDRAAIVDGFSDKFDLESDKLEGAVEHGLYLALKLLVAGEEVVGFVKSLKTKEEAAPAPAPEAPAEEEPAPKVLTNE